VVERRAGKEEEGSGKSDSKGEERLGGGGLGKSLKNQLFCSKQRDSGGRGGGEGTGVSGGL